MTFLVSMGFTALLVATSPEIANAPAFQRVSD